MSTVYDVIKRPLLSEKSNIQNETLNVYSFEVLKSANKQEIKEAIERLFKVKVDAVRTSIVHGKYKRVGRFVSKRGNWKKASVTLKDGQKIELFQGV